MKYSIIPEMINFKAVRFLNENSIPVKICETSPFVYTCPFRQPFFVFDRFAKRTTKMDKIISLSYNDLKRLGYCIYGYRATPKTRWRNNQKWIWVMDKIGSPNSGATILLNMPTGHKVIHDTEHNQIKLMGENAGPRHFVDGSAFLKLKD